MQMIGWYCEERAHQASRFLSASSLLFAGEVSKYWASVLYYILIIVSLGRDKDCCWLSLGRDKTAAGIWY